MTEKEVDGCTAFIPQRVRDAFNGAEDFGQFRARRSFVYLHLFSGSEDMMAKHMVKVRGEGRSGRLDGVGGSSRQKKHGLASRRTLWLHDQRCHHT